MCRPPVGRAAAPNVSFGEESPGSTERRCRLMAGEGDLRESATENEPLSCGHRYIRCPVAMRTSVHRCPVVRRRSPSGDSRGVRVKRWGKSPPRTRQRGRHGKPHREQDRIGAARARKSSSLFRTSRPGWLREASGNGRPRRMAATWGESPAIQNPAYRPTGTSSLSVLRPRRTGAIPVTVATAVVRTARWSVAETNSGRFAFLYGICNRLISRSQGRSRGTENFNSGYW